MTDQPTTWTPERALQCLRDWASDECDWPKWRREYEDGIDHGEIAQDLLRRCGAMVAAGLESAAAEIERQKARADAMRKALIQCGRNVGGGLSDDVSDDFLMHVPEEARLVVDRLRAELAAKQPAEAEAAKQGPSDTLIAEAVARCEDDDRCSAATYHALQLLARRAGVKL